MNAVIEIKEIAVDCVIGVSDAERAQKQTILITLELVIDAGKAVSSDAVMDTVDYKAVYTQVIDFVESSSFHLLETLTTQVLDMCMEDSRVQKARVTVEKPARLPKAKGVSVTMRKERKNE